MKFIPSSLCVFVAIMSCGKQPKATQNQNSLLTEQFSNASKSQSTLFTYYAKMVKRPKIACSDEARELADRFTKATSYRVFSAECKGEYQDHWYINVAYTADKAIISGTTQYGYGGVTYSSEYGVWLQSYGIFSSFDVCVEAVSEKMAEYEKYVGKKPLAARCFRDMRIGEPRKFILVLDHAAGLRGFLSSMDLKFDGAAYPVQLKNMLEYLTAKGNKVIYSNIESIIYYPTATDYVFNEQIGDYFDAKDVCEKEFEAYKKFAPSLGLKIALDQCYETDRTVGNVKKYFIVSFAERSNETVSFDIQRSPRLYDSYADCISDKATVLNFYRDKLKRNMLGAICSSSRWSSDLGKFAMDVLGLHKPI